MPNNSLACHSCPSFADIRSQRDDALHELAELKRNLTMGAATPKAWKLTPTEERFFLMLIRLPLVSRDLFINALKSDTSKMEDAGGTVRTFMSKLRAKVQKFGIEIPISRADCYHLPEEIRQKYRYLLNTQQHLPMNESSYNLHTKINSNLKADLTALERKYEELLQRYQDTLHSLRQLLIVHEAEIAPRMATIDEFMNNAHRVISS